MIYVCMIVSDSIVVVNWNNSSFFDFLKVLNENVFMNECEKRTVTRALSRFTPGVESGNGWMDRVGEGVLR